MASEPWGPEPRSRAAGRADAAGHRPGALPGRGRSADHLDARPHRRRRDPAQRRRSATRRRCSSSPTTTCCGCWSPRASRTTSSVCARWTAAASRRTTAWSGAASPRTGSSSAARRRATGWSTSWWRSSASPKQPSAATADAIYDQLSETLAQPEWRIRPLFDRFNIEMLSTTDAAHSDARRPRGAGRGGLGRAGRADLPPRRVFYLDRADWRSDIEALAAVSGVDIVDYPSFLAALQERRLAFVAAGGLRDRPRPPDAPTRHRWTPAEAGADLRRGAARARSTRRARRPSPANMLFEMRADVGARTAWSCSCTPGCCATTPHRTFRAFGRRQGLRHPGRASSSPGRCARCSSASASTRGFRLILFTIDETVYSRELAPLAGVYPAVKLGRAVVVPRLPGRHAALPRSSSPRRPGSTTRRGFVDDTRAFASIPARHDLARRIDAGYLAKLVAEAPPGHRRGDGDRSSTSPARCRWPPTRAA